MYVPEWLPASQSFSVKADMTGRREPDRSIRKRPSMVGYADAQVGFENYTRYWNSDGREVQLQAPDENGMIIIEKGLQEN